MRQLAISNNKYTYLHRYLNICLQNILYTDPMRMLHTQQVYTCNELPSFIHEWGG